MSCSCHEDLISCSICALYMVWPVQTRSLQFSELIQLTYQDSKSLTQKDTVPNANVFLHQHGMIPDHEIILGCQSALQW